MINNDDITMLAGEFVPRLPGSPMERRAARYVVERLEAHDVPVAELPIRTPQSFVPVFASIFAVTILGVLVAPFLSWVGLLISLAAFAILMLEIKNIPVLSRLLATNHSYNVLGLIPQQHGQESDEPRRRVILSAHLDSARAGLLWQPSFVAWLRPALMLVLALMIVVPVVLLIYAWMGDTFLWLVALLCAIVLLVAGGLLLEQDVIGRPVAGANDNASGVAALLGIAESLRDARPEHTEVWLLFTAGKEAGLVGMKQFLAENQFNLETTFFINIDNVGSGNVCYTRSEGMLLDKTCSPVLVELAQDIVSDNSDLNARPVQHRLPPTDGSVILNKGYQSISLIAYGDDGRIPNWHQITDTPANLESGCVESAARLALEMIRRLDLQVGARDTHTVDQPLTASDDTAPETEVERVEPDE